MTAAQFWDHIRASRRIDPEAHAERLEKRLAKLPPEVLLVGNGTAGPVALCAAAVDVGSRTR